MSLFDPEIEPEELTDPQSVLEELGAELGRTPEEIIGEFVARTPLLTESERAELLGEVMESVRSGAGAPSRSSSGSGAARPSTSSTAPSRSSPSRSPSRPATSTLRPGSSGPQRPSGGGFDWGRLASALRTGFDIYQQGARAIAQFSGPRGRPSAPAGAAPTEPGAPPGGASAGYAPEPSGPAPGAAASAPAPYGSPGAAFGLQPQQLDHLAAMIQALRSGHIPPLPGQQPAPAVAPGAAAAPAGPGAAPSGAIAPPSGAPLDATAMLRLMLANPQLHQALQWSAVLGPAAPREVELPVPASGARGRARTVRVPLGAVLNTIMGLTRQSMAELHANGAVEDPAVPEYLLGEDGEFLVDPASSNERAALVEHLFRLSHEAERAGWFEDEGGGYEDESESWAREAGWLQ